jgi:ABC-type multidrug transport system ATPase subunit
LSFKDACLEVKQGEVVGIIGRNDSGKSTLSIFFIHFPRPAFHFQFLLKKHNKDADIKYKFATLNDRV